MALVNLSRATNAVFIDADMQLPYDLMVFPFFDNESSLNSSSFSPAPDPFYFFKEHMHSAIGSDGAKLILDGTEAISSCASNLWRSAFPSSEIYSRTTENKDGQRIETIRTVQTCGGPYSIRTSTNVLFKSDLSRFLGTSACRVPIVEFHRYNGAHLLSQFASSCLNYWLDFSFFGQLSQFSSSCLNFHIVFSIFGWMSHFSSSCLYLWLDISNERAGRKMRHPAENWDIQPKTEMSGRKLGHLDEN
ncbi:hypothetical protein V9T40_000226 [Parthenolecanium corni]|uniref:Uncharacterized protein n=1 Tax=Parthenolecanium corni TaxID=536013 RepID=A0AAN9Y095_9HEMI